MSLHPTPIGEIPPETLRIARAAFPRGTVATRLRDEFSALYGDEDFRRLYPNRGQPGLAPWRLALVTVFQFLEHLSDRQAADAVRARIDWKYALGLELTDPGFHFSVLTEFRARLVTGGAEHLLLDRMLDHFKAHGLVKARGRQRTDSTHVLAAVHDLHLLELVAETLRATLDDLAAVVPDWLRKTAQPVWFERYARRIEDYRLPKSQEKREALALEVGADGFFLLDALDGAGAPLAAREIPMVQTLRDVWRIHYARDNGRPRWRSGKELPPVGERLQSPYDPEMHYSTKRQMEWSGYKVHVTETCDADTAHLITHVKTCPAMQPDMASTAEIHECLAAKGLLPSEHFVDSAYVDAALLVGSQRDHGVSLEGPVRGMARRRTQEEQAYEQRHFTINWEHEQVTCPQGKASVTWRAGLDEVGAPRIQAVFSRTDCGACTARTLCTPAKAARRSVYFHPRPEYEALNAARARMHDPAWQQRYHIRAGIEGTLSQGVRALGMRRSRYIGLAKTDLQEACTGAAMNALRAVQWLAGVPRSSTRVTRFMALAV
ncbi:IS1182 family transposase [Pseudoroseomonas ludipueritiae]|uniref:IS1182 family transposase n=1 Tax=Pseudoroseomonas ludipueritiae TaxID=198093 RepID=A0ABR7RFK8_9PROT|nr:IS1182 family transposase [Pseudoroseomonas ludipueritiae]MBC9180210.1 IS1182 family transposase [Pseudoroseomonas ludipueritiae]